jgi:hypothetical protein
VQITRLASTGSWVISLVQRVAKGTRNGTHIVRLEGWPDRAQEDDFVWLLAQYLSRCWGLELSEALLQDPRFLQLQRDGISLWGYVSRDAWCVRLDLRMSMAGFERGFFTGHSPRYGFLLATMVTGQSRGEGPESLLNHAAVVAQWAKRSPQQLRYLREGYDRLLICTHSQYISLFFLCVGH